MTRIPVSLWYTHVRMTQSLLQNKITMQFFFIGLQINTNWRQIIKSGVACRETAGYHIRHMYGLAIYGQLYGGFKCRPV